MFFSGISDEAGRGIQAQIRAHKDLGWAHMELRNVDGELVSMMDDAKFDAVYGAVSDAGMRVSCFAAGIANWSRFITGDATVDYAELRRAIPRMHRLGTPYIRIMSYPNDPKQPLPEPQWRQEVFNRLRNLATIAEDGGIVLLHENCSGWGGQSAENTLMLLNEIDSPALRLVFDTGNPVAHGQNAWQYYSAVRDAVVYVHIKDARAMPNGNYQYCFCGEGDGFVREILDDLAARSYEGGVSIEPHIAAVVHGQTGPVPDNVLYSSYVDYGNKLKDICSRFGHNAKTSPASA